MSPYADRRDALRCKYYTEGEMKAQALAMVQFFTPYIILCGTLGRDGVYNIVAIVRNKKDGERT